MFYFLVPIVVSTLEHSIRAKHRRFTDDDVPVIVLRKWGTTSNYSTHRLNVNVCVCVFFDAQDFTLGWTLLIC